MNFSVQKMAAAGNALKIGLLRAAYGGAATGSLGEKLLYVRELAWTSGTRLTCVPCL